jgi:hypothetical protein
VIWLYSYPALTDGMMKRNGAQLNRLTLKYLIAAFLEIVPE